jgi:hypothetical protein
MTPKPILRYAGLVIFIIGLALNIWMFLAQAWPTYLFFIIMGVGGLLFGLSFPLKKLTTFWQILIVAIPFIISYIIFKATDASHDIFLIPEGFRGQVLVLYGQTDGQPKEFEGKWRIYRVPQNGILRTPFQLKGDVINLGRTKYFFIGSNGNKTPINAYCESCETRDTSSVQIIYGSLGGSSMGTFQDFYVDVPNSKKATGKFINKLDSLERQKSGR